MNRTVIGMNAAVMMPFLQYQAHALVISMELQTGDASPLPVLPILRIVSQGVSHSVTPRNDEGLPPGTSERSSSLRIP
jgi:hypothetical protein